MNKIQVLTEVATEGAEAAEEAFNLVEALNGNLGVVMVCIAGFAFVAWAIYELIRNSKKPKGNRKK